LTTPNWLDCPQGVYYRIWPQVNRSGRGKIGGRYPRRSYGPNSQTTSLRGFAPQSPILDTDLVRVKFKSTSPLGQSLIW